ncbi:MAG: hypothetical protein ACW97G_10435 [Candidatus Thorarchaeota archaeon]
MNSTKRCSILILVLVVSITIIYDFRPHSERAYASQFDSCTVLSSDSSGIGPNISWSPDPNVTMFFDGAYTGQSQEIFEYRVWVNDSLGVDSVIFRFKWSYEEEWLNRTTKLIEGDGFHGRYRGNLTWPAPGGGRFEFKVFANNTLGHWNETSPMTVYFGYLIFPFYYIPQFWLLVTCVLTIPPLTLVAIGRLKRKVVGYSESFERLQAGVERTSVKLVLTGFLVIVTLRSIGYTWFLVGGAFTTELSYLFLGLSLGLVATVMLSYLIYQVLKK